MKRTLLFLPALLLFFGCATTKKIDNKNIELTFLDDFVIPPDLKLNEVVIGGLSGIDYHNDLYYLICDQPSNPRFYKAEIRLKPKAIDTVIISEMIALDKSASFLNETRLDPEGIRYNAQRDEILISSEGAIKNGKDPAVFKINRQGEFLSSYGISDYFKASGEQKPRNNGVFEGLAMSFDKSGYWVAMELPLEKDGPKPKLFSTNSPVRITYFDAQTEAPQRQFAYKLDGVSKIPLLYYAINGVTEILEYEQNKFLVLERAFSAGYGSYGYTVKIFDVNASAATDVLNEERLRKTDYRPAEKRLVFNFKSVKKQLSARIIDNIEGMCLGPILPSGKQSLLLVSDNNFNSFSEQINQFILMEIDFKD